MYKLKRKKDTSERTAGIYFIILKYSFAEKVQFYLPHFVSQYMKYYVKYQRILPNVYGIYTSGVESGNEGKKKREVASDVL